MSDARSIYGLIDQIERAHDWEDAKGPLITALRKMAFYAVTEGAASDYGESWKNDYTDALISEAGSQNRDEIVSRMQEGRKFEGQAYRHGEIAKQKKAAHRRTGSGSSGLPESLRALMNSSD